MAPEDLKNWRQKHGYSQRALATALGVFQVTVARWETGVRKIPPFLHLALVGLEHMTNHELNEKDKPKVRQ